MTLVHMREGLVITTLALYSNIAGDLYSRKGLVITTLDHMQIHIMTLAIQSKMEFRSYVLLSYNL